MATAQEIIIASLRLIGVVAAGETPAPEELDTGLESLNSMLGEWSTLRPMVYATRRDVVNCTNAVQTYTIGIGGTFNVPRPLSIKHISAIAAVGLELPMDLLGSEDWAKIVEKTVTGTMPRKAYYNNAYPLGTIYVWPVPSGTPQLAIESWVQLAAFTALSDTVTFPPGYEQAIKFSLAAMLAAEYGRQLPPTVAEEQQRSMAAIGGLNQPNQPGVAEEAQARVKALAGATVPGLPPGSQAPTVSTPIGRE